MQNKGNKISARAKTIDNYASRRLFGKELNIEDNLVSSEAYKNVFQDLGELNEEYVEEIDSDLIKSSLTQYTNKYAKALRPLSLKYGYSMTTLCLIFLIPFALFKRIRDNFNPRLEHTFMHIYLHGFGKFVLRPAASKAFEHYKCFEDLQIEHINNTKDSPNLMYNKLVEFFRKDYFKNKTKDINDYYLQRYPITWSTRKAK